VLEKLFSVPADEDAEEADEEQEQDAGMQNHIPLVDQLLIMRFRSRLQLRRRVHGRGLRC
jgi:hypothetical protein